MKRHPVFFILFALSLLLFLPVLSGCGSDDEFDEAAFLSVSDYVDEVITAVGDALLDLDGWVMYPRDEERVDWLAEHIDILLEVDERHFTAEFPDYSEMEQWTVTVIRGEAEWQVQGEELVRAVKDMRETGEALVQILTDIVREQGDVSEAKMEEIMEVSLEARAAQEALHELFFNSG